MDGRPKEAAIIYMELAEQGVAVAQLNAAILFDKYNIFPESNKILIGEIMLTEYKRANNHTKEFNINKHLAFKYFSMAYL